MDQRAARQHAVDCFEGWINGDDSKTDLMLPKNFQKDVVEKLQGKNLACWCPLDHPCHADVLLRLANGQAQLPDLAEATYLEAYRAATSRSQDEDSNSNAG